MKDVMELNQDEFHEGEGEEFERLAVEQEGVKEDMDPEKVKEFRASLRKHADIYVSDAFGTKSRIDPSTIWNGSFLPSAKELDILPKK